MSRISPKLDSLFGEAVAIEDAASRNVFLSEACRDDRQLCEQLTALVAAHFQAEGFLEQPVWIDQVVDTDSLLPANLDDYGVDETVGPYRLRELLGEGGMGTVFVAEQMRPVRRKVALKVIKAGLDSRQIIARFEAERQVLTLMEHPHIARVLDAGTSNRGRPYFVMELIKGLPITEHCDQHQLPIRERLQLLLQVCQAVQHAHQKAIIHRDLKPSNILVTVLDTTPTVKVIDFGVAKALDSQLSVGTLYTGFSQIIGTPQYMSPEQAGASGLDVDTRSDVYSLGILLYELLTGSTPIENETLQHMGFDGVRDLIRELDPPRPSARVTTLKAENLSTVAACRRVEPSELCRQVRGELDWIVLRALEKDRSRRYASPSDLAIDLERYLRDEPISACPPTLSYRLRKFLARNRRAVVPNVLLCICAVVLIGVICHRWVENGERRERLDNDLHRALIAAKTAIAVGDLEMADEHLAEAQGRVAEDRGTFPELASEIDALASDVEGRRRQQADYTRFKRLARDSHDALSYGEHVGGEELATQALQIFGVLESDDWERQLDGTRLSPTQTAEIRETIYVTLVTLADYGIRWPGTRSRPESVRGSLDLLRRAEAMHAPTRALYFVRRECCTALGNESAARIADKQFQNAKAQSAWDYFLPGHTADWKGDDEEAVRSYQAALELQPDHFNSLFFLAFRSLNKRDFTSAEQLFRACQALRPNHAPTLRNRSVAVRHLGQQAEALSLLDQAVAADPTSTNLAARSDLQLEMGQIDEALDDATKALALDPHNQNALALRGTIALRRNQFAEAAEDLLKSVDVARTQMGAATADESMQSSFGNLLLNTVFALVGAERCAEARVIGRECVEVRRRLLDAQPADPALREAWGQAVNNLYLALKTSSAHTECVHLEQEAITTWEAWLAETPDDALCRARVADCYGSLAQSLALLGRNDEARAAYERALALEEPLSRETPGNSDLAFRVLVRHVNLANLLPLQSMDQKRHYLAAVETGRQLATSPSDPRARHALATVLANYGQILLDQPDDAHRMLQEAVQLRRQLANENSTFQSVSALATTLASLAACEWKLNRADESRDHYREAFAMFQAAFAHDRDEPLDTDWQEHQADAHGAVAFARATCPFPEWADVAEATKHAQHALAIRENSHDRIALGIALYRNADYQAAVVSFEQAFRGQPQKELSDLSLYVAALAYWHTGQYERSREMATQAKVATNHSPLAAAFRVEAETLADSPADTARVADSADSIDTEPATGR